MRNAPTSLAHVFEIILLPEEISSDQNEFPIDDITNHVQAHPLIVGALKIEIL